LIYKSVNAGNSWNQILGYKMVMDILLNPVDTSILYASIGNLTNNSCFDNAYSGFYLTGSSHNLLNSNKAYSNDIHGIYLDSGSNNNTIINNNATNNTVFFGFYLLSNSNNTLINNLAQQNQRGFYIQLATAT
jgi:parallel beta-helix repeat protein